MKMSHYRSLGFKFHPYEPVRIPDWRLKCQYVLYGFVLLHIENVIFS
jgi:hypothetical protein